MQADLSLCWAQVRRYVFRYCGSNVLWAYVDSKGLDQLGYSSCLFTESQTEDYIHKHQKNLLDRVDAQADLGHIKPFCYNVFS